MAERGEIRASPRSLQVSVPPTHSSCYATSNYNGPERFFQEFVWSCVRTYAVWGVCPAPIYFVSAVSMSNGDGSSPVPCGPRTAEHRTVLKIM